MPPLGRPTLALEAPLWQQGVARLAGIDEVGRGALAGCVVAAAVILPPDLEAAALAGVSDSKLLSRPQRERLVERIERVAVAIAVGSASVIEIDRLNIRRATALAMERAIERLGGAEHLLVDGLPVRDLGRAQTAVVKGDRTSLTIAAASIVAKVTRDRWMHRLDRRFPGYGWQANVGYGTAAHLQALAELGVTPFHRRSFAPVRLALDSSSQKQNRNSGRLFD
ncbi:ribonuclease HII [Gloeobacter kilaueensis]|uniref:Ribonuclease HII n=1 Tax=Gloeobacter kilaueensis (strain ATCC BAA-2537 / CCAP 1431/1 / ULC 316 / JS1) TaxID=1183438 RepID=U5QFJ5_GLOK1|nr:ribonuclease HII [Gloeobacter kilaueensis]AGY56364.1 ribonuclease HII [Gloeobacter kilaueensis JS1]